MVAIKKYLLFSLTIILIACQPTEQPLADRLGQHLDAAHTAHQQATHLWDQWILAGRLNCLTGLPTLPLFSLTQMQADQYPAALIVRDHLNQAITLLEQAALTWDTFCADSSPTIALERVNDVYHTLAQTELELNLAQTAYDSWYP